MNTTNDNNLTAKEWYEQGNGFRQQGNWQQAINCYLEAIELDPCSPAVEAKEMHCWG